MIFMAWLRGRAKAVEKNRKLVLQEWEDKIFDAADFDFLNNEDEMEIKKRRKVVKLSDIRETSETHQNEHLLSQKDLPHLLFLWNYLHESLRGKAKINLNNFAHKNGIAALNSKLFKSRLLDKKLLAINTFGNLADENSFEMVEKLIAHRDSIVSFWAFRALFRINTSKVLQKDLQMIAHRKDWSPIFVAKLLREVDSDELSEPLVNLVKENYLNDLEERQMSRLISYLVLTHRISYNEIVNKILAESTQIEVIIACLRLVCEESMLARIRELLKDERWQIRMHAVLTLGRFGKDDDLENLIYMLNDLDWWVRYRSACTLFAMPSMTVEKVTELSEILPNQFSRDILKQVLAENKFQCSIQTQSSGLSK